ncbi:MAG: TrbI/VirB10 family protein [Legionella sp.]|uniref:TrbI/VirB10 family protein n=1 Tax=Legionella sp. TaxID=459 RepID=UPI0039E2B84D
MSQNEDWLSAEKSPEKLEISGVRRVNNWPLVIILGVALLFVLLIVLVAIKRADGQTNTVEEVKPNVSAQANNLHMANEIVGKYESGIVPSARKAIQVSETVEIPVAVIDNPNIPPKPYVEEPIPDTELERIRQEKTQQFEEAVKAKSSVLFDKGSLTPQRRTNPNGELRSHRASFTAEAPFKEMAQGRHSHDERKPMPLGGGEDEGRWHLNSRVSAPETPFVLTAGSVIPGAMISGIRSDLPNQIIGQVTQNVYDTATGRYLLIPQGTKLLGIYSSDVAYGQDTLLVAWQRLTFPDGKKLDIGSMPGTDGAGFAGFRDRVNNHYGRIFGSAFLMSGIVAGMTYSQNQNQPFNGVSYQPTAGSVLSQALGQQLGEVSAQLIMKNLNVAPSIEIGSGYRFNIITVKDLVFKRSYVAFDYY